MPYSVHATRDGKESVVEHVERQGTAWRRARLLYAAGFSIVVVQLSSDDPPQALAAYRFDGVRWKKLARSSLHSAASWSLFGKDQDRGANKDRDETV